MRATPARSTPRRPTKRSKSSSARCPASFLTLTATTEREQSFEDPNLSTGFGFFTYFLVQAFRGYADNDPCDGRITADELIEYVRSNVRRYARERQLSQTPTARGDYEPEMLLGVGQGCLADGTPTAPSMLGTAIVETNMDDVDLYIDGELIGKVSKDKPLVVPSLSSGLHEFQGVKAGYEPDRKEVMIAPGQEVDGHAAHPLRAPGQEAGARSERAGREAAVHAPLVAEPDEPGADGAQAERSRSAEGGVAVRAGARRRSARSRWPPITSARSTSCCSITTRAVKYLRAGHRDRSDARRIARMRVRRRADRAGRSRRSDPPADRGAAARRRQRRGLLDAVARVLGQGRVGARRSRPPTRRSRSSRRTRRRTCGGRTPSASWPRRKKTRRGGAAATALARDDYRTFLDLTNFSSGLGSKLAFHFIGFGVGSRRHADRQGAYDSLRSAGFLGLCLSEQKVGNPLKARDYCQRALQHAPNDPIAHFLLGNVNRDLYNVRQSCDVPAGRANSYLTMIALNPDLDESKNAQNYVSQIDGLLPRLQCG